MQLDTDTVAAQSRKALLARNATFEAFFHREAPRLAAACREMSERFTAGGRLLAFGRGPAASDAQHVSVEFVHPVIVGKRALPAMDLGPEFAALLPVIVRPNDMVMCFALPAPDKASTQTLHHARQRGALTFGLAGEGAAYAFTPPDNDTFISQEIFELLYHLLWETVHVYFEHREQGHDVGASSFLYPFLGKSEQGLDAVVNDVQASMLQKMEEVNLLRTAVAETEVETLSSLARAITDRLERGGKLILFGNGGSATDANDLALDCVAPPPGIPSIPAISLSTEPAIITAVANDIGSDEIFMRQLIAHGTPDDIAIGISTSGSSPNILAALIEARKRGLLTAALAGYDGGRVASEHLADHVLIVRSDYIPRIQEVQASLYHILRAAIATIHAEGATHA
jgi:D-sedoheptulose 7-phosphate isomerase